jgi:NDP-sugar pyrophosphorylase family protein
MCLYYFSQEKLGLIREYLEAKTDKHDATGFYIDWLRKEETVYGFIFKGRWYDIGHHKFYQEAQEKFKSIRADNLRRLPHKRHTPCPM